MKRVGDLMDRVADMENLREAFLRAVRGKAGKAEVVKFRARLDENLLSLHRALLDGTYRFGHYRYFRVFDPKPRTICAAEFSERVAQHALLRILHPVFDGFQIYDSYACRVGKGAYKAIERARQYARQYRWFVKMDVRKFFNSIDHNVLYGQLERLFKDRRLLAMLYQLIGSYEMGEACGLPIGNLSSQYFANHYLGVADHYAKEQVGVKAMVRYMDDIVFWGNNPSELKRLAEGYRQFVATSLKMELHPLVLNRTSFGMPFLGYVVYPDGLRLNQRSRHRFRRKLQDMDRLLAEGRTTETECRQRYAAMHSFIEKANVCAYRQRVFEGRAF